MLVPVAIILVRRFDLFDRASRTGPDRSILRSIWSVGWPSSIQLVVRILAMIVTGSLVARAVTSEGEQAATTPLGVVFRLETEALFVAMGWGSAAQTFIGQNLGARQTRRARQSGFWAAVYDAILMFAIAAGYRMAAEPIIACFTDDPRVISISLHYAGSVAWSYIGLGTGVVLGSAINGAGATRTTLVTDLALVMGFQIPTCTLAVLLPGTSLDRLWAAVAATYVVSAALCAFVFRCTGWLKEAPAAP